MEPAREVVPTGAAVACHPGRVHPVARDALLVAHAGVRSHPRAAACVRRDLVGVTYGRHL